MGPDYERQKTQSFIFDSRWDNIAADQAPVSYRLPRSKPPVDMGKYDAFSPNDLPEKHVAEWTGPGTDWLKPHTVTFWQDGKKLN